MLDSLTIYAGRPRPEGNLLVSRPRLHWRIQPEPLEISLLVDGRPVGCRYDRTLGAVVGYPRAPLKPGTHIVLCHVAYSEGRSTDRRWEFNVLPGATANIGVAPTALDRTQLSLIQGIRQSLGLDSLSIDPSLQSAVAGHARYLLKNRSGGHLETASSPGFLGRTPSDRASAFGFSGDLLVEDVAVLTRSGRESSDVVARESVVGLFEAPYHRLPFLNPSLTHIGISIQELRGRTSATATVLLFGGMNSRMPSAPTVVSPFDGQTGVPCLWRGDEIPDPLRLHENVRLPVGFPLVFAHFPKSSDGGPTRAIRFDGASLRDANGRNVPILTNSPLYDGELRGQAIVIIPRDPLLPGTFYRATVTARNGEGMPISRTWKFQTAR